MDREQHNRIITGFLFGVIGTGIALAWATYFWWLGSLFGFVAGYLSHDWQGFLTAITRAARKAYGGFPTKAAWKAAGQDFVSAFFLCLHASILLYGFLYCCGALKEEIPIPAFLGVLVLCLFMSFVMALGILGSPQPESPALPSPKVLFPPFFYGWYLPKGIVWLLRYLVRTAPAVGEFVWVVVICGTGSFLKFLFIEVHSNGRLLRGFDYAIGIMIGYLAGHVLVGGIAAAAIAELDLELVSRRWLKLSVR